MVTDRADTGSSDGDPTHRVRPQRYSAGTGSASLDTLPIAMIFERPATAIAVRV
jgi:hypothetical protein